MNPVTCSQYGRPLEKRSMKTIKEYYNLGDFEHEEVQHLLSLAQRLENHPEPHALSGKVLAMLFLSPSLRTLTSFQATMAKLGGGTFVVSPEMSRA